MGKFGVGFLLLGWVCTLVGTAQANEKLAHDLSTVYRTRDKKVYTVSLTETQLATFQSGKKARTREFGGTDPRRAQRSDDRDRIEDTTSWPHRTVGQLELGCSGTMVGPRHVLTAGHCLYNAYDNEWNEELTFYPGMYDAKTTPFGAVEWERAYTVQGWTEKGETEFDIGLLVLKERVGLKTGWMAYGYDTDLEAARVGDTPLEIIGYPADKPESTMWRARCPLLAVVPFQLHYECITYGGSSGSGVWVERPEGLTVMGVHTNGGEEYNLGTRLIGPYFHQIRAWVAANP